VWLLSKVCGTWFSKQTNKMHEGTELDIIYKTIKEEHPFKDNEYYRVAIAIEVLRIMVGNEWTNQSLFKMHSVLEKRNVDAFEFFGSENHGPQWGNRITRFAEWLFNLKNVPNLRNVIADIRSGELLSRIAELEVGRHLLSRGIKFEYVLPSGNKGLDFDIRITDPLTVNCEIKHKIESTEFSENTLINTLRDAGRQLPKDTPAIIFIKFPEKWLAHNELKNILIDVFDPIFKRKSEHLIGIMLRWEETFYENNDPSNPENEIMFTSQYKFYANHYYLFDDKLNAFVTKINDESNNWVYLDEVIKRNS
jgi:hypothetical protein